MLDVCQIKFSFTFKSLQQNFDDTNENSEMNRDFIKNIELNTDFKYNFWFI